MKKLAILTLASAFSLPIFAQIPVTDVALNTQTTVNQILNITTFTNQLNTGLNQLKNLQTTLKYVQKVSSTVRNIAYAKDLVARQERIVKSCKSLITTSKKLTPSVASNVASQVEYILSNNNNIITLVNSTLTDNLKMNDSERMQTLMKIKTEQTELMGKIHTLNQIIRTTEDTKNIAKMKIFN